MAIGAARRDTGRRLEEDAKESRGALMKSEAEGVEATTGAVQMNNGVDIVTTEPISGVKQGRQTDMDQALRVPDVNVGRCRARLCVPKFGRLRARVPLSMSLQLEGVQSWC